MNDLITWPTGAYELDDSTAMYAVLAVPHPGTGYRPDGIPEALLLHAYLGRTPEALRTPDGEPFQAEYGHLTQEGKTLCDTARHAWGIEPLLLTYTEG